MRKGETIRWVFTVACGITFPLLLGVVQFNQYSVVELLGIWLYFLVMFLLFTVLYNAIRAEAARYINNDKGLFLRLPVWFTLVFAFSVVFFFAFLFGWLRLSKEDHRYILIWRDSFYAGLLGLIYGLCNEIEILGGIHLLDKKIVEQLDKERISAELTTLSNELDMHFLFNSLTTLSHLIATDTTKANLFNEKLAQVYRYILLNKNRELISLQNEIEFIEDYFYLLEIRHEGKLLLDLRLDRNSSYSNMVLPCSLQQLVENAIKHNEFSKKDPLQIRIQLNGSYIKVMNNLQLKSSLLNSTKLGLRNLNSRYILVCNKPIIVEEHKNFFIVKLPLISQ